MAGFNRIIMLGNLTRDPQLSYTASNTAVCKFGLATNRKWRDREGNDREDVCFVDCTVFGKSAETLCKYMSKGRQLMIEGRLELNTWTTPEGDKRSKHGIFVENFTFVGSGGGGGNRDGGGHREGGGSQENAGVASQVSGGSSGGGSYEPPPSDDIPF